MTAAPSAICPRKGGRRQVASDDCSLNAGLQSVPQTAATRARIRGFRGPGTLMMVTHQVNITALTSAYPATGEIFLVRANTDDTVKLIERITPPAP